MIFMKDGVRYQVLIGTEGGIYLSRWEPDDQVRHGTPTWRIFSGPYN